MRAGDGSTLHQDGGDVGLLVLVVGGGGGGGGGGEGAGEEEGSAAREAGGGGGAEEAGHGAEQHALSVKGEVYCNGGRAGGRGGRGRE